MTAVIESRGNSAGWQKANCAAFRGARRRGFTLIEVLVVLLIASIVLTILATVLGSTFEIMRTGESRSQLNASARNALNYLCTDIEGASGIPRLMDRDLDGYEDSALLPALGVNGYGLSTSWAVSRLVNNVPVVDSSIFLSNAFADRIMTVHFNDAAVTRGSYLRSSSGGPRPVQSLVGTDAWYDAYSLYRLAVPANAEFPYLLAAEQDTNGDNQITGGDLFNTGVIAGQIDGYPEQATIGTHRESGVLIQDVFYRTVDKSIPRLEDEVRRIQQLPIAGNITSINFAYFHNVPVYHSRVAGGGGLEIAYQDLDDGEIRWVGPNAELNNADMYNAVPLLSHWEQRQIDVAYDSSLYTDSTGATYAPSVYSLADMYPEGFDPAKLSGTHTTIGNPIGLNSWNCSAFYDSDSTGDNIADNAPIDRLGFITTGEDGAGNPIEGGMTFMRPDMQPLLGDIYYQSSINPTGVGDMGDADGIPDGDGVPDDPVPGWWLPYLRAVRVTVTATPREVIDSRRAQSGKPSSDGTVLYYRLDSPMPYLDADRTQPLPDRQRDYIGQGKDIVLTKTVEVDYYYRRELASDPIQYRQLQTQLTGQLQPQGSFARRVELNVFNGADAISRDPAKLGDNIKATSPSQKLGEKDPTWP